MIQRLTNWSTQTRLDRLTKLFDLKICTTGLQSQDTENLQYKIGVQTRKKNKLKIY